jgi:hypothetical protein
MSWTLNLPCDRWGLLVCRSKVLAALCLSAASLFAASDLLAQTPGPFAIEVVDRATGRGVPLVVLETVGGQQFVTDSSGLVAVVEPDLMGQAVYFHIRSHGYEVEADGFGFRGKRLDVSPGGSVRIELDRINIAQRLYRVTGSGIYRDTQLLGREPPIRQPRTAPQVVGCDSTLATVYRDRIHWFWGDTNRMAYPLGNFHMTGATSRLPDHGGLDPAEGIELEYFTDGSAFVRPMARMPGDGPTWLGAVTVLPDAQGNERLVAHYVKIRNQLEVYRWGMCQWDDDRQQFEHVKAFDGLPPAGHGQDHAFRYGDAGGTDYVYFSNPLPLVRVKADLLSYSDPGEYERFTCLQPGTRLEDRRLDRDEHGRLHYTWKSDAPLVTPQDEAKLLREKQIEPEEALYRLCDPETLRPIIPHRGSVYWNEFRRRWVAIFGEQAGETSFLGEIWYAEADAPTGPWRYARKIVTHDRYSFYNPKHHPFFDQQDGRLIYFEGTYTHSFSGNPERTPRYDYNQVMYRLDLEDDRLRLPVAVYDVSQRRRGRRFATQAPGRPIAFFALDRPGPEAVAIVEREAAGTRVLRALPVDADTEDAPAALFYALPADMEQPPAAAKPLYEFVHEASGRRVYTMDGEWDEAGYRRSEPPLCLVWML